MCREFTGKEPYKVSLKENQNQTQWFHNYSGEKAIIIDEFEGQWTLAYLKEVLDGWKMSFQTKKGFVYAEWQLVVITSNLAPQEWYNNWEGVAKQNILAITKRITRIST